MLCVTGCEANKVTKIMIMMWCGDLWMQLQGIRGDWGGVGVYEQTACHFRAIWSFGKSD